MSTTPELEKFQEELRTACQGDEQRLFALFDAARLKGLPVFLREIGAEFASLYRGKPQAELAQVAPYMVKLPLSSLVLPWLLVDTAAAEAAVILVADGDPDALRQHLRRFLIILDARGAENFFRFYDPRVIGPFLEVSTPEEAARFFGPIRLILTCASIPPATKPAFRRWAAPAVQSAPAPPTAFDKFVLRPEHEARFAKDSLRHYEQRCVTYLRVQYTGRLESKSDEDVRQIVSRARETAAKLGIEAGRDVTTLAEVLVLDPDFGARKHIEGQPARDRARAVTKLRDYLSQQAQR